MVAFKKILEWNAISIGAFSGLDNSRLKSDEEVKNDRRNGCSTN